MLHNTRQLAKKGNCLIKADYLPEMKKDKKYAVFATIDQKTQNVTEAACSCPAGRGPLGSCKHIAALLKVLSELEIYLWIWEKHVLLLYKNGTSQENANLIQRKPMKYPLKLLFHHTQKKRTKG